MKLTIKNLVVFICFVSKNIVAIVENNDKNNDEVSVYVSPACAISLLGAGAVVDGTVYALSGPLESIFGFSGTRVLPHSFAAWWKSTFPFLKKEGSLVAGLHSISIASVGKTIVISNAVTANRLTNVCQKIDALDKETIEKILSHVKTYFIEDLDRATMKKTWKDMKNYYNTNMNRETMEKAWNDIIQYYNSNVDRDTIEKTWKCVKDYYSNNIHREAIEKIWTDMKTYFNTNIDREVIGKIWKDRIESIDLNHSINKFWSDAKDKYRGFFDSSSN